MSQLDVKDLVQRLSQIDEQLVELLCDRVAALASCSADVPVWEQQFESVLRSVQQRVGAAGALGHAGVADEMKNWLMHGASLSARLAKPAEPIAYLGPIYSYSYLAAVKHFGSAAEFVPVSSISAAFEEVLRDQAAFGVVPIENSTDGRIVDTLGIFAKSPSQICGEVLLPIHHCLLGRCRRDEITEVHSKPQALSQCREWLTKHLPEARLVEVSSTATAAQTAATLPGVAAIASREAGMHHGCELIVENIEDNPHNVTRFAIIGKRASEPTKNDKTSLMVQLRHQPGALAGAMSIFQSAGINLTWIESFPLPNRPNEYLFFIELEGHRTAEEVSGALIALQQHAQRVDVLGSYPKGAAD